jgi:hypothetical protein
MRNQTITPHSAEGKDDMAKSRSWFCLWVALAASVGLLLLAPSARAVVLYDQTNSPEGLVSSQDFESGTSRPPAPPTPTASYNAFDTTVADDFTVPSGESWTIHGVHALGNLIPFEWSCSRFCGGGITPAARVRIYEASGTLPGAAVFTSTSIRPIDGGIEADLALPVRGAPALPPGHYWVSVQAIKDLNPLGQWSWTETAVQSGDPSVFENPGNGFGTGCTTFMPKRAQCSPWRPARSGVQPERHRRLAGGPAADSGAPAASAAGRRPAPAGRRAGTDRRHSAERVPLRQGEEEQEEGDREADGEGAGPRRAGAGDDQEHQAGSRPVRRGELHRSSWEEAGVDQAEGQG